jgi:hypothetical protein
MTKTPEEGDRTEEESKKPQQTLQKPHDQNQPAEGELKRVPVESYFPEIFLG